VVRFELRDRPADGYWLILRRPQPELCTRPSGYAEDLVCRTDSATLMDLHLKRLGYPAAIREGRVDLIGPPRLTRQFRSWFRTSPFADFLPAELVSGRGRTARIGHGARASTTGRSEHELTQQVRFTPGSRRPRCGLSG
jgi:hypothetical protein